MDTIVERPAALDVHKAQVTACVRVPNDRGEREERIAEFQTTVRGLLALRDWAGRASRAAGGDGGHRRLLEGAVGDPRRRVRLPARERPACQAGPGPQDRRLRRRLAVPARRGRLAEGELRATQAGAPVAQPHALSEDADPGALTRGQPAP